MQLKQYNKFFKKMAVSIAPVIIRYHLKGKRIPDDSKVTDYIAEDIFEQTSKIVTRLEAQLTDPFDGEADVNEDIYEDLNDLMQITKDEERKNR